MINIICVNNIEACAIGWSLFFKFQNVDLSPPHVVPNNKLKIMTKYEHNWSTFRGSSMQLKFYGVFSIAEILKKVTICL